MRRLFAAFLLSAIAAVAGSQSASAAPQILGVIAYNEPVPLSCATGQCWAELVTICLQKERANPLAGTPYRFHGPNSVELIVTDADGNQRRLPASEHLNVKVARGFTAVRVELTERELRELGGVSAAVTVGNGMSLVPVKVAGDPDPISARELAYATEYLRTEADRWLASNDPRAEATRVVNRMINMTPRVGRMTAEGRATLLSRAEEAVGGELSTAGRERAATTYDSCRYMVEGLHRFFSMRRCLETKHDSLMLDTNTEYWRATTPGS
ncbi:MAG: hypothetical protein VW338_05480 [Rhodospirillaceae bacterium]|jgi:hypothetical protein